MTREQMIDLAVRNCIEPDARAYLLQFILDWTETRGWPAEALFGDGGPCGAVRSEYCRLKAAHPVHGNRGNWADRHRRDVEGVLQHVGTVAVQEQHANNDTFITLEIRNSSKSPLLWERVRVRAKEIPERISRGPPHIRPRHAPQAEDSLPKEPRHLVALERR